MKNSTKVRLHLSKKLFESLTREIIKEAKANDGYTVAVKQPKQPKQSKSQATSPEVQKTDAEAKMEAAPIVGKTDPIVGKTDGTANTGTLRKDLLKKAQEVPKLSGISSKEAGGLQKLLNTILAKAPGGELAVAIDKAQRALDISTQNIKVGDKSTPTSTSTTSVQDMNMGNDGKPAIPGLREKMSSKEKMAKGLYNEVDAEMDTDKMKKIKEMEMNVAEEGQMNEMTDAVSWEAVAAGMAAMGLAPLAINKMQQWWKKKYPKSFKAAQGISAAMDRQAGNTPGQGHGVDTSKTFGPQNEKNAIKEYENDDYRVVNGECRRYNDEHEYVVVSMSNCR